MKSCLHPGWVPGQMFDYCHDCGAVRDARKPDKQPGEWHTCPLCDTRTGTGIVRHSCGGEGMAK